MTGKCENCARRETCKKEIGFIFGFCNTDFLPENGKPETEENKKCGQL